MIHFYSFWLGDETKKREIESYHSKLEKLNKNIKFHFGPSLEEHDFLMKEFKFYKNSYNKKNYSFCSDVWRIYKILKIYQDSNNQDTKHVYVDSKTLFNEEKLNEFINVLETNKNVLIKEKPWQFWSGFFSISNEDKKFLFNSLNFYYKFPFLSNIFIAPHLISIYFYKSFDKEYIKNNFFILDARNIDPCQKGYLFYNGYASWTRKNKKKPINNINHSCKYFHDQAIKFENDYWKHKPLKLISFFRNNFFIIFAPFVFLKSKMKKNIKI